ncbi:MAG TPA: hypothetical protein H9722_09170, partial [Candidatus Mediterraneibacter pullistercoris]|nr:hypothetical protein [Candidatus Mediterraneibacter pullistercoris]
LMCFYLRNWQVTFLLYTLGVFISEYTAKAFMEPRDYRVVFLIQSPEVPKGTSRDCKRSPGSRAGPDFGSSPTQKQPDTEQLYPAAFQPLYQPQFSASTP